MKKLLGLIAIVSFAICVTSCNKNDDEIFQPEKADTNHTTVGINKDEVVVPVVL